MPRSATYLHLPQPCAESWDAMTPAPSGRHCAACQKTVVDFSQLTDAQILTYLARATGETCGRFHTDQLERPLVAVPDASRRRWPHWLALALAAWGAYPAAASSPAPFLMHRVPQQPVRRHRARAGRLPARYVRGTVRDSASQQPLVGVAVFLRGENRMATTDSAGRFRLQLSPRRPQGGRALVLHFAGYQSATVRLPTLTRPTTTLRLALAAESHATEVAVVGYAPQARSSMTGGAVVSYQIRYVKPWPWHPRFFYRWAAYHLSRPFRRSPKTAAP